jgi:hypothetical protein
MSVGSPARVYPKPKPGRLGPRRQFALTGSAEHTECRRQNERFSRWNGSRDA